MTHHYYSIRLPLIFLVAAVLLCTACLLNAGPLPMDITITQSLQAWLGENTGWASFITTTAKHPLVWSTLIIGCLLARWRGGIQGLVVACSSFAIVKALDVILRLFIYAPKPSPDIVPVAAISHSSGLPSTFVLVYGAVFGAVLFSKAHHKTVGILCSTIAITLLVIGISARVILGGHWMSQALASLAISFSIVQCCYLALNRWEQHRNEVKEPARA